MRSSLLHLGIVTMFSLGFGASAAADPRAVTEPPRPSSEDGAWKVLPPPPVRSGFVAVFDPLRQRMLIYGGSGLDDVWSYSLSGSRQWSRVETHGASPSPRHRAWAFYDRAGDRLIVGGGRSSAGPHLHDAWALSLGESPTWSPLLSDGPDVEGGNSACYDSRRNRLVAFVAPVPTVPPIRARTWTMELDPPRWTQISSSGPGSGGGFSAVYDSLRDWVILFAGRRSDYPHSMARTDAFLLASGVWRSLGDASIGPREGHAAVFDPAGDRMVVFGGNAYVPPLNTGLHDAQALAFDKGREPLGYWSLVSADGPYLGRSTAAVYDPVHRRMIVYDGSGSPWELALDGSSPAWTAPDFSSLVGGTADRAVYDPRGDRYLLFNGACCSMAEVRTMDADGRLARLVLSGEPPSNRSGFSAVYDPRRHRVLVFGGNSSSRNDPLWELRLGPGMNATWSQLQPAGTRPEEGQPPTPLSGHCAIYDPRADRMLVYGGAGNRVWSLSLGGTLVWSPLNIAAGPSRREGHSAVYDPVGDRMVVFGGASRRADDSSSVWTLSLRGAMAWSRLPVASTPAFRTGHTAIYDPVRHRMVLFGGERDSYQFLDEVLALDLRDPPEWKTLFPASPGPRARTRHTGIYDPVRDRMMIFRGRGLNHYDECWALEWDSPANPPARCAGGITGSAGNTAIVTFEILPGLDSRRAYEWTIADSLGWEGFPRYGLTTLAAGETARVDVRIPLPAPDELNAFELRTWLSGAPGIETVCRQRIEDLPVPILTWAATAWVVDRGVSLEWRSTAAANRAVIIERSQGGGPWAEVAHLSADADGLVRYVDESVEPENSYRYRLAVFGGTRYSYSDEITVVIPARYSLALESVHPNPTRGGFQIAFTLPDASPAELQVFDVRGRLERVWSLASLGPGRQVADLAGRARLSPGIYWVRLVRGTAALSTKVVVLE